MSKSGSEAEDNKKEAEKKEIEKKDTENKLAALHARASAGSATPQNLEKLLEQSGTNDNSWFINAWNQFKVIMNDVGRDPNYDAGEALGDLLAMMMGGTTVAIMAVLDPFGLKKALMDAFGKDIEKTKETGKPHTENADKFKGEHPELFALKPKDTIESTKPATLTAKYDDVKKQESENNPILSVKKQEKDDNTHEKSSTQKPGKK